MILYGSQTSPFVRRIRLLLPEDKYKFVTLDLFKPEERKELLHKSPLLKIPILEIDGVTIWDSRIIFNHLCKLGFHRPLKLHEENLLTAIQDVSDSLVQLLLAKRSNITLVPGTPLYVSHYERIENTFNFLVKQIENGNFAEWNFLSMCLYTLVDWVDFRQLADLEKFPKLLQFRDNNKSQQRIDLTDPRK